MTVSGINNATSLGLPPVSGQSQQVAEPAGQPFKDLLLDSLSHVNQMQADANQAVKELLTGDDVNMADVFTAVQKADMSFRMMMQIRNKLVAAYQEIKDVRI